MHLDLVGPLPVSRGFSYLLTCVDRFSRWPEAIPIADIRAETVVRAFIEQWVARFGAPSTITTDRGQQFESSLFASMLVFLGCTRIRTTSYHPAANGMVERFHRQLKASLMAGGHSQHWAESLPLVLLGIRSTIKEDLHCCPAELVFGASLRLPGELVVPAPPDAPADNVANFVHRLRHFMRSIAPQPPRLQSRASFVEEQLSKCSHVFVRCDRVRKPLEPPYEGPFPVMARSGKVFTIHRNGKADVVSVDRLKAACTDFCGGSSPPAAGDLSGSRDAAPTAACAAPTPTVNDTSPPVMRSGRRVHFPDRLLVTHF